ncbi:MAG: hypothetical protein IPO88_26860 [Nannocystis sp.]|uniref:hypothetical protein n=1 Tax=Nannocystis sp. TaxID=1962667 RepID=UPI0024280F0D|nr:hypothetical protein [Nannocystis sp.]MBK9757051.1 hypothetical protein [Nannocystis sp.]
MPQLSHARPRPRLRRPSRAAGLVLLACAASSSCYAGDFFDRLVDPDATAAFRITELTLVDPHTYSGDMVLCQDSTDTYNQLFAENIGSFDINTTLVLHPLDPSKDTETTLDIVPAKCVPGGALVNCTDKDVPPASIVSADFNNSEGGTCGNPVAGTLNPSYQIGDGALNKPTSPCFLSALIPSLSLQLAPTLGLPLSNVQIYAAYDLAEPQKLVQGVLFGFLPSTVAMSSIGVLNGAPFTPWSVLAGGNGCKTSVDDIDTVAIPKDGVWMYFNFTAERVAWSSASDPPPEDTTTATTP